MKKETHIFFIKQRSDLAFPSNLITSVVGTPRFIVMSFGKSSYLIQGQLGTGAWIYWYGVSPLYWHLICWMDLDQSL